MKVELQELKIREYYEKGLVNNANRLLTKLEKQQRNIKKFVEDEVRYKFGTIAELWKNESSLYSIIRSLYPNSTVYRRYRPPYLHGLEFDIFIEEMNLALEYQGMQHFEPVEHWGGIKYLRYVRSHDQYKKEICDKLGISLVYFNYKDKITKENVQMKLLPFNSSG